ncbi:hypothetical protein OPIT5_20940 [Opitutaceae bacterium TAV5]|nr:hypothetical protein OPIT5_20940 [Opitutaceae bacterium TAV5]
MTRILRPFAFSLLLACASHQASAQAAATAAAAPEPQLLVKYTFENIPAHIPGWGAGHGSTYKPATGWKTPFTVKLDATDPHSGTDALRIQILETTNGEKIVHTPSIPLPEADAAASPGKVIVHLYARAKGLLESGAAVRILERDASNKPIGFLAHKQKLATIKSSDTWQEITAQGTLNPRTRNFSLMIVLDREQTPATVWVDDISIELQPAQ